MPKAGLEPAHPKARRPKRRVSTSSTTSAHAHRLGGVNPKSLRSLATWPVALTLYWASSIVPSASTTKVERMTPWTTLP